MKKYLPSGAVMDIERNATGGFDVTIIGQDKTFDSIEEALPVIYSDTLEVYDALRAEGIIGTTKPKPKTQKKKATSSDGYTWNPSAVPDSTDTLFPATTTYGVTPTQKKNSSEDRDIKQDNSAFNNKFPADATYVASPYIPSMQIGPPNLREIAEMAFPADNGDNIKISGSFDFNYKGLSTTLVEKEFNANGEINNPGSTTKRGGDIGIFGAYVSDSQKFISISSNKISLTGDNTTVYDVREHREYISGGFLEINGVVESREVWVGNVAGDFSEKVVYQYRTGIIVSAAPEGENPGEANISPGVKFQANSDWTDVPIPKDNPPLQTHEEISPGN